MECIFCSRSIELDKQAVRIDVGSFQADQFFGRGFENPFTIGYAHFDCVDKKDVMDLNLQKLRDVVLRQRRWHAGECRGLPNCSECYMLNKILDDLGE